jgi:hypothetical protein|tara:strand:+ start:278 stop:550 length:273 start_codon:yes stop_codon:yes gene_type:complete
MNRFKDDILEGFEHQDDQVNHPSHYRAGHIECIDYISDFLTDPEYIGYLRGSVAKYLHRWPYKNGHQDLKKAAWYLDRLIKEVEANNDND